MADYTSRQETEWRLLHDRITATLNRFGRKDAFRNGDYWLVDDNWGWERHQVEIQNLDLLVPDVVKSLQSLLSDFPDWDVSVRVDVPGEGDSWPGMGLIIYRDEILDELRREFLPEKFRDLAYDGAARLGEEPQASASK